MANLARRRRVPPELPVAGLIAAAAQPLSRLFLPGGFAGVLIVTVLACVFVSWGSRRLRFPPLVAWLVSMLALVWFVSARFFPDTLWGPFPTPSSLHAIGVAVDDGARQSVEEVVPVAATTALLMFVAAGIWVSAWLAHASLVWARNPLLSIACAIPLFATPGTLLPSPRRWFDVAVFIAAAAWLLFSDEGARADRWTSNSERRSGWRPGPAVRLVLVGILAVVVLSPLLPGYGAPPGLRNRDSGSSVTFNPLVAIRPTLRRNPEIDLFTVQTDQPTYYRLTALDHFDGDVWSQAHPHPTTRIAGESVTPDAPGVPAQRVVQTFVIGALAGPWLPVAYDPVGIDGVADAQLQTDVRAVVAPNGIHSGSNYQAFSQVSKVTAQELDRPMTYDKKALRDDLQLPRAVPEKVRTIARQVAGSEPTPYRQALALQDYLRTFIYDEKVAAGHGFKDIVEFLTVAKRGYCEQFAGAMAVLARTLGIPARVAVGFGYGPSSGPHSYRITTREAHAWVEIFFSGEGWIAFEPTPRAGVTRVPDYAAPSSPANANPSSTPTEQPSGSAQPSRRNVARDELTTGPEAGVRGRPVWVVFAVIAAAAAAAFGGLVAFGRVRVLLRHRRAHTTRDIATLRYVDFLGWCASIGYAREPGETPAEHSARLRTAFGEATIHPLGTLTSVVEKVLWAPPNGIDPADVDKATEEVRRQLKPALSRRQRAQAALGWGRWRAAP
jgi:transglutaminase-like putative cysteine protease